MAAIGSQPRGVSRRDLGAAGFLIVFGAIVMWLARSIPLGVQTDPLGPRAFPLALGAGIILCGILLAVGFAFFRSVASRRPPIPESDEEGEEPADSGSRGRLVGTILATAAYLLLFERLGYLLSTPLYAVAILLLYGRISRRALLAAPLAITVALYVTFHYGLRLPLPTGLLQ